MASMEELKADIKRNQAEAVGLFDPTGQHVKNTLWPFLEGAIDSLHDELTAMGERIVELEEGEAELLYEETGEEMLTALELGATFAVALQKTIGGNPNEAGKKLLGKIVQYSALTKTLVPHIQGIMLEDEEDADAATPDAPAAAANDEVE
jgi:hypothetical protein